MFIDKIYRMFSTDLGIDLGTANTLVAVRGQGIVCSEPSVVAVHKGTKKVLNNGMAVGQVAKDMIGKCPGGIEVIRPMKMGVGDDFEIVEQMLRYFIRRALGERWHMFRPRVVIGVPTGIDQLKAEKLIEHAELAGAREVFLIEEPLASAIGVGLPVTEPRPSMIVDIGGGTCEVAVLSLQGIVQAESVPVAGDDFDRAIMAYVKEEHHLEIGQPMAERIKFELGNVYPMEEETEMEVRGTDEVSQKPRRINLNSEEVRYALDEPVGHILAAINMVLERIGPTMHADIIDMGITLAGGGALLRGIDKRVVHETGLPVKIGKNALTAVACGTAQIMESLDLYAPSLRRSHKAA